MTKTTGANLAGAVSGFVAAVMALLVAFGLHLTVEQQSAVLGFVGAVSLLASVVIAMRGMDRSRVVEQLTPAGHVLAGEASELPTGARIRDYGSLVTPSPMHTVEPDPTPDTLDAGDVDDMIPDRITQEA